MQSIFYLSAPQVQAQHVPRQVSQQLFRHLFGFVNGQLFNQLLLRRECCSFSNGEYMHVGLAKLQAFCQDAGREWVGNAWDEMR